MLSVKLPVMLLSSATKSSLYYMLKIMNKLKLFSVVATVKFNH